MDPGNVDQGDSCHGHRKTLCQDTLSHMDKEMLEGHDYRPQLSDRLVPSACASSLDLLLYSQGQLCNRLICSGSGFT